MCDRPRCWAHAEFERGGFGKHVATETVSELFELSSSILCSCKYLAPIGYAHMCVNSEGSDDACTNGDVWSSVCEHSCGQHVKSSRILMCPFTSFLTAKV